MKYSPNLRTIDVEHIDKMCTYRLPKGVRLKDFVIEKNEHSDKICIIGVGGGGINIVKSITKNKHQYYPLMAHMDHSELYDDTSKNKLYLLSDIEDEEILTLENRYALSQFVSGHKKVYIVTTFGRETHKCEAVDKIVQHLHRIRRETTMIVVKPFLFEVVPGRIRAINATLKKLETFTEKILLFHNEDLLDIKEKSTMTMPEVFSTLDTIIASVIEEGHECDENVVHNIYLKDLWQE